jgi:hypothetical protein
MSICFTTSPSLQRPRRNAAPPEAALPCRFDVRTSARYLRCEMRRVTQALSHRSAFVAGNDREFGSFTVRAKRVHRNVETRRSMRRTRGTLS